MFAAISFLIFIAVLAGLCFYAIFKMSFGLWVGIRPYLYVLLGIKRFTKMAAALTFLISALWLITISVLAVVISVYSTKGLSSSLARPFPFLSFFLSSSIMIFASFFLLRAFAKRKALKMRSLYPEDKRIDTPPGHYRLNMVKKPQRYRLGRILFQRFNRKGISESDYYDYWALVKDYKGVLLSILRLKGTNYAEARLSYEALAKELECLPAEEARARFFLTSSDDLKKEYGWLLWRAPRELMIVEIPGQVAMDS